MRFTRIRLDGTTGPLHIFRDHLAWVPRINDATGSGQCASVDSRIVEPMRWVRSNRRTFLACLCLAGFFASAPGSGHAQDKLQSVGVVLQPDGTWQYEGSPPEGMADRGVTRVYRISEYNPEGGGAVVRRWEWLATTSGVLQVAVNRSLEHPSTREAGSFVCSPMVIVRNLINFGMHRVVIGIRFLVEGRIVSSASIMAGPLDPGEQSLHVVHPIHVERCHEARGEVFVEACFLNDQLDCSASVVASEFGPIPLSMAEKNKTAEN